MVLGRASPVSGYFVGVTPSIQVAGSKPNLRENASVFWTPNRADSCPSESCQARGGVGGKCIAEFCLRAIEHILWPWQPSPWLHPTSVFLSVGFPSWVLRHALSCQPLGTRSPFLDLQFTAWRLLTLRFKDVPPLFSKLCANDQCSSSCVFFVFFN